PVRTGSGDTSLRAARLARGGVSIDVGGIAASEADDAARVAVEPHRTAVPQVQAGGVPAHVGHRPARANLIPTGARMRLCPLALAGLAGAVACARHPPPAPGPNVVTITATDYAFGGPDTIPAGLTTLRLVNQGKELHHASLVRLGDGKTIADFQAGLQAAMTQHTPPPPWIAFAGGPNAVTVGDTAWATQAL